MTAPGAATRGVRMALGAMLDLVLPTSCTACAAADISTGGLCDACNVTLLSLAGLNYWPRCGSTLRLIAAIEDPAVARRILECLKLPARSPPVEPASWAAIPPEPAAPDRDADWEFDQSRPAQQDSDLS